MKTLFHLVKLFFEDRAVFILEGIDAATYEVAAWWVPFSNRATNTPFTIFHSGAGSTVNVDHSHDAPSVTAAMPLPEAERDYRANRLRCLEHLRLQRMAL